ncbi:hypothetical protein CIG75_03160 [Tumebacillus algifaecis]|uniref:DUF2313 domain-containing protein n=1 Tax=Tumebacillus algifaecis TaxID=1214604 RepID=A0A223CXR0_9BACL|nr:putative phage tail protein [Tumebacillus algifaecis]ASS74081.1 hypothetical protein CIG75_03160 [Tumebacillus algifaecis]
MSERDAITQAKLSALMSYAPDHYRRSELYQELMEATAVETVALRKVLEDVFAQFFVETATWGLAYWELEYGLITNESLSYPLRRALVLQKMRGTGTLTYEKMASILSSYGARTAVIESDFENYHFDAVLVDFLLSPKRPHDDVGANIRDTIEAVRPAHLGFLVHYREHLADSFRDWFKDKTGLEFEQSDQLLGLHVTSQYAEMKFGMSESDEFRLNHSRLGVDKLGGSKRLADTVATYFERLQDQEYYELQGKEGRAFRINQSRVNAARTLDVPDAVLLEAEQINAEQVAAAVDLHRGMQIDVVSSELSYRVLPQAFRFSTSTQDEPLIAERLEAGSEIEQTQSASESHPLQLLAGEAATTIGTTSVAERLETPREQPAALVAELRASELAYATDQAETFQLGQVLMNRVLYKQRYADVSTCVLYQADQNGVETVLEQRVL